MTTPSMVARQWKRVPAVEARKRYQLPKEEAKRVVRVSAGMRLRDFAEAVFAEQMAMPVAGSTDAQSIGGLIATDLHSTGHTSGFLSQQLLEVLTLDAKGKPHRFVKDESKAFEEAGRWKWIPPSGPGKTFRKLPVCGALGMTGVVVEAVLKLVPAFNFLKDEQFVPRTWAEANIEKLLDPGQTSKLFAYDHVSLYYGGGKGPNIRTIRLNTWKHTKKKPPKDAMRIKRRRELADHIGSAFLPNSLLKISSRIAPVPGSGTTDGASKILVELNKRPRASPAGKSRFCSQAVLPARRDRSGHTPRTQRRCAGLQHLPQGDQRHSKTAAGSRVQDGNRSAIYAACLRSDAGPRYRRADMLYRVSDFADAILARPDRPGLPQV